MSTVRDVYCVWLRYFAVFRKHFLYGFITTFTEPLLFLFSFGFGLGALVGNIEAQGSEISYRQFILSGIVAQSILFQGFFEAAYGSFIRMYYQKIFQAIAVTPITLDEVLWAEILWDATRGLFASTMVLVIGASLGDFSWAGSLMLIPICFLGSLVFSSLGLWMAALSQTIEQISYPQYLVVFPMFLFCGIYYPLESLPEVLQWIVWVLPLTSFVAIIRFFTLDFPLPWFAPLIATAWLVGLVWVARRAMRNRLVK